MDRSPSALLLTLCLVLSPWLQAAESNPYQVDIRWTAYGIPHIKADDWGSLGYGIAWATAQDAVCVLAREFVRVNGDMARFFGHTAENVDSDAFHRALLDRLRLDAYQAGERAEMAQLGQGYVAAYNRFIAERKDRLPASCRGQPWVQPIDRDAVSRMSIGVGIRYGLGAFQAGIANAAPGDGRQASTVILKAETLPGSNALAFGRNATVNGRGLLLGNPHYPWEGPSRFHMLHVTIPGQINAMGVGLYTTSFVAIGFNEDVAWSHTVSTALRFTLFELQLVDGDPLAYRWDGEVRRLEPRRIEVQTRNANGEAGTETRTVYLSHLGPVVETRELPWTAERAYVVRDVNLTNNRGGEQYFRLNRARNVQEVMRALSDVQGVAFTNTIAADSQGQAFYGDLSVVPNVSSAQIEACRSRQVDRVGGRKLVVLDGSRSACDWRQDPDAAAPGLMPGSKLPRLITSDYVANSNDSYWLSNPDVPLEGYSAIVGDERTARTLRTRAGLSLVREVLQADPPGRFDAKRLRELMYEHRDYGAELVLDEVLALCADAGYVAKDQAGTVDLKPACDILDRWDRRHGVASRGAQLFFEFWKTASIIEGLWSVPFDPQHPIDTPRGINGRDPRVRGEILSALAGAIHRLESLAIPLDAPWGEVQYAERNGEKIGIPGGAHLLGLFSVMHAAEATPAQRYSPIVHGNSYIQVVGWDDSGHTRAQAILTYSQSAEPDSPHYADQTRLYSSGGWVDLPFTEEEIARDPQLETLTLTADRGT